MHSYQWLEFDIYVDPVNLPKFYGASAFAVELFQSQMIEGGKIIPGTWQHVRIPLDVFSPLLSEYHDISINQPGYLNPGLPIVIYLDNILLKGQ